MDFDLKKITLQQGGAKKNFFSKKFENFFIIVSVLIGIIVIWSVATSSSSIFQFVFSKNSLKTTNDRVNILLLGIAGGNHAGAELTDSIIIASYNLKTHHVILISVPRDVWLDSIHAKVNAAYEIGLASQNGSNGLKFAEDKIDDILGIPIHYGVRLDFSGFSKALDLVGGVDVEVQNTFDDYNYPIEGKENDLCGLVEKEMDLSGEQIKNLNAPDLKLKPGTNKVLVDAADKIATGSADYSCRYEHIHFEKGKTHMDGTVALKFVRSRMGTNQEGTDFARSKRQQLVLQAFRGKVLSFETLVNPQKLKELAKTFGLSFETDIPTERALDFIKLIKDQGGVKSLVLGDLGNGKSVFINPPPVDYGGAYVLIPQGNDFKSVKDFLKSELEK